MSKLGDLIVEHAHREDVEVRIEFHGLNGRSTYVRDAVGELRDELVALRADRAESARWRRGYARAARSRTAREALEVIAAIVDGTDQNAGATGPASTLPAEEGSARGTGRVEASEGPEADEVRPDWGPNLVECPDCDGAAMSQAALNEHLRVRHGDS